MRDLKKDLLVQDHEVHLKKAVQQVFDHSLKAEFAKDLAETYGITSTKAEDAPRTKSEKPSRVLYLKYVAGIAASLFIFFMAYQLLNTSAGNLDEMSQQFAYAEIISHPGASKGSDDNEDAYNAAVSAFNQKQWPLAIKNFESLTAASAEISYYLGMSHFYAKNYPEAITQLDKTDLDDSPFAEEAQWYLALSYILNQEKDKGVALLQTFPSSHWKYSEAQQLIEAQ